MLSSLTRRRMPLVAKKCRWSNAANTNTHGAASTLLLPNAVVPPIVQSSPSLYSTSTRVLMSLEEFRDPVSREKRATEPTGRSWTVRELRRKSYDDLWKLWHVLYKESNMLLTESYLSRRHSILFPQPDRRRKVKKSLGAIRQVLGERKREKIANHFRGTS